MKTVADEIQKATDWYVKSIFAITPGNVRDFVLEQVCVIGFKVSRQIVKMILYKVIELESGSVLDRGDLLKSFEVIYFSTTFNRRSKGNRSFT